MHLFYHYASTVSFEHASILSSCEYIFCIAICFAITVTCLVLATVTFTTWYTAIFYTWYRTPVLAMLYLTYDTGHRYLPCYTWPWYMTLVLAMLYLTLDIWHRYLPCHTWHMYITPVLNMLYLTPDTCITWHMHDYYFITSHLVLLYLLYSWTLVLLNPWKRVTPDIILLILYSC